MISPKKKYKELEKAFKEGEKCYDWKPIGNGTFVPETQEFFFDWDTTTVESGHYILMAVAMDEKGNEASDMIWVTVDNDPATTNITFDGPYYWDSERRSWIISPDTYIGFSSDDKNGVGVNTIYYRDWHNGRWWTGWRVYDENFTLPCPGLHYTEFYSVDYIGNIEETNNVTIYVGTEEDTEPPTIVITWPEDGYESEVANITVTGYATDNFGIVSISSHHEWEGNETWTSGTVDPPQTNYSFEWIFTLHEGWNRITIYAEDEAGNHGEDKITVYYYPENYPPDTPTQPEGPTEGEVGQSLHFESYFSDPDGDSLEIMFDWGDGTNTDWVGPIASGTTVGNYHSYSAPGTYQVRTKARDVPYLAESGWSPPLTVTIS